MAIYSFVLILWARKTSENVPSPCFFISLYFCMADISKGASDGTAASQSSAGLDQVGGTTMAWTGQELSTVVWQNARVKLGSTGLYAVLPRAQVGTREPQQGAHRRVLGCTVVYARAQLVYNSCREM